MKSQALNYPSRIQGDDYILYREQIITLKKNKNSWHVTDQMGSKVTLDGIPQRIISLVPSDTELVYDLGAGKRLVGITDYCIHPADQTNKKTTIGGPKQFNFAAIDALRPDFIIGNKEENYQEGIEQLRQHYPVWMSDINTLEDALEHIECIAQIIDQQEQGQTLVAAIRQGFEEFTPSQPPATVAYLIWDKPLMVAGGQTFIHELLTLAGYTNIFVAKARYPQIKDLDILNSSPDLIFLSSEPYPFTRQHLERFQKRFPSSKVVLVDGEMFSWYGSHLKKAPAYFKQLAKTV